ncbi:MAG: Fe-S-containing hydro-lyase [Firmicutes bacterium]|nr:Fe-S-containing hydro-lyase [Bacillota bacterium]
MFEITTPFSDDLVELLRAGDRVVLSGVIYTARDAAHARMAEALRAGEELPFPLAGNVIYYVGPAPAKPGWAVGSAGPTTSGRMDSYTPELLRLGLKGMIGKGARSEEVKAALREYKAVYFAATGGAGALLAKRVVRARVIAYPDLGPEAVHEFVVDKLPLTVVNDMYGGDLYLDGRRRYARQR